MPLIELAFRMMYDVSMAYYTNGKLRTKDSELVAYLHSLDIKEFAVGLEPDRNGRIKAYFYFDEEEVASLVDTFERGEAQGNVNKFIKKYKEVISFVIGVTGTGKPQ